MTVGFDGSARIFDAESGQQLERLRGPSREVLKVAFSSDGRHVAVGGLDGALRIYACGLCGSIDDLLRLAAQVHRPLSVDEQVPLPAQASLTSLVPQLERGDPAFREAVTANL